jgi:hypothetical protein
MPKHWWEAAASFVVVGLGQIIKGEGEKGLILLLTFYFVLPGLSYAALAINGYLFLIVLIGVTLFGLFLWLYSLLDALLK